MLLIGGGVGSSKMTAFLICFRGSFMNLKSMINPPPETSSFLVSFVLLIQVCLYFTVSSQAPLVHECEGFRGKNSPVPDPWLFCIHYVPRCLWRETEVTHTLQNPAPGFPLIPLSLLPPCPHTWYVRTLHIILMGLHADKGKKQEPLFLPQLSAIL